MKSTFALLAASVALVAQGPTWAQTGRTLNEARSAVINGTTPGIVLIPASPKAPPQAASAPASGSAPAPAVSKAEAAPVPATGATGAAAAVAAPGTATAAAAPAATAAVAAKAPATPSTPAPAPAAAAAAATPSVFDRIGSFLRGNEPLSGESLNTAKQHTSPTSGIVLPTAASRAASAAPAKP
jgi:hypothetical protein